jgi:hypothetical protein
MSVQSQAEPRRWTLTVCPDCGNHLTGVSLCGHQRGGGGPTGIDFSKMVPVAVREDRAVAADIEATAKAMYDSKGKPHGRFVDDTSRPGIRIYRSFEWEELTTIAKATFRVHARAILAAVFREVADA